MKKLWALLIFLVCVGIYVAMAPFNPPVFFTILGGLIVGFFWDIDYLVRLNKEAKAEEIG